jgi:hypothetical protein
MTGMSEEDAENFEARIGMRTDPEADAQAALRAHQEQMGIVIENPDAPVGPDDKALAMAEAEELDKTSPWMGGGRHG